MINLLPPELTVSKGFAKTSQAVRSLTVLAIVIYIVFGLGILGFFIFSSVELGNLTQRIESFKKSIRERETTEQALVLLKDRVEKIKDVKRINSASEEILGVSQLLPSIGASSLLSELSIDAEKVDVSIIFKNSAELASFLGSLKSASQFNSVVLTSFGFNPANGYLVSLRLAKGGVK